MGLITEIIKELDKYQTLFEKNRWQLVNIDNLFKNFTGKVLVASDFHIPYVDKDCFKRFIKDVENKEIKVVVICGDFINFDSFNRYITLHSSNATEEIRIGRGIIEYIYRLRKKIIFIMANHEKRLEKFLIRTIGLENTKQVKGVIEELYKFWVDITKLFVKPNMMMVDNWWVKFGNVIIGHPEVNSKVRHKSIKKTIEFFSSRVRDWDGVLISHTHNQDRYADLEKFGIEVGCMCRPLDYALDSRMLYSYRVQKKGYVVADFKDGETSFDKIKLIQIKEDEYLL